MASSLLSASSSVDRDGTISVLISMAGELGQKLVAASMGQEAPKSSGRPVVQPTQSASPVQVAEPQAAREPKPRTGRFSTVALEIGVGATIATLLGNSYDEDLYTYSDTTSGLTYDTYTESIVISLGWV
ncbi:MAG TPA: hypothetical protein VMX33_12345 [bacterium]|nr:hypothetical protein [bacterium]